MHRPTHKLYTFMVTALAGLMFMPPLASAQTVWRCVNGEATRYTEAPCPGGHAVDVSDGRSAQQVQASRDTTARLQAMADKLHRERKVEEAQQARQAAMERALIIAAQRSVANSSAHGVGQPHRPGAHRANSANRAQGQPLRHASGLRIVHSDGR